MKWIAEHFQLILAIAGGIAYWLNQQRAAAAEKAQPKTSVPPASMADADDAARAEQVREEIRRKIAARRGGPTATSPTETPAPAEGAAGRTPPPLMRPRHVGPLDPFGGPARTVVRRTEPERPVEPPTSTTSETLAASLQRQEQLAKKLQELTDQRALAGRRATAVAAAETVAAQRSLAGEELRSDLRDPRSLRRAMILRELLGPPVALR